MKKYTIFMTFILLIVLGYVFIRRSPKSYNVEYFRDGYKIIENYDKEKKLYKFNLAKENVNFVFVLEKKYSPKRKIVSKINEINKDNTLCLNIVVFKNKLKGQCIKNNEYMDPFISGLKEYSNKENVLLEEINNIKVYSKNNKYYIWNNYGITNVTTKKEYNFLNNESYSNSLSYQLGKYLLFADYDSSRIFNKFYIFDAENEKIKEWKIDYSIAHNAYFMGDKDGYIYLFDKKYKKQYKINIAKKKISIVSDDDGGIYYEDGWKNISLDKLTYNEYLFKETKYNNYQVKKQKIYMSYADSAYSLRISNQNITNIINIDGNKVYYLSNDSVYLYTPDKGEEKLLTYFEWNFSYLNKIFIFS